MCAAADDDSAAANGATSARGSADWRSGWHGWGSGPAGACRVTTTAGALCRTGAGGSGSGCDEILWLVTSGVVTRSVGAVRRVDVAVLERALARAPDRVVLVERMVLSAGRLMERRTLSVVRLIERTRVLSAGRLSERTVLSAGRLMDRRRLSVVRNVDRPELSTGRLAERRVVVVTRLTERPVLSAGRLTARGRGGSLARESLMREFVRPMGSIRRLLDMPLVGSAGLLVDLLTVRATTGCRTGGRARDSVAVPLRAAGLRLLSAACGVMDPAGETTGAVAGRDSDFVGVAPEPGGAGDGMPASASALEAAALIL